MKKMINFISLLFVCLGLSSCFGNKFKEDKVFVGGKVVSAETLNLGHLTYIEYCISCHGEKGNGIGVASKGLYPPPRDFTKGLFKFGLIPSGELPHDDHLKTIIRKGLKGSAMLPWDISDERLEAVTQYIKTFAPQVWEDQSKTLGVPVELKPDPYSAQTAFAVQKGKEVYHMVANCQSCHRAYVSKDELNEISLKVNNEPMTVFDETMYQLKLQESEYQVNMLPPDFTWHEVRSATTVPEIAYRLAAGVGGTSMPSWKGVIEDEDIWAVSYYVKSLMDLKGKPERQKLLQSLK